MAAPVVGRGGSSGSRNKIGVEEPTFVPRTLGVKPSMTNARAYLQDDVFTRLSQSFGEQQEVPSDSWDARADKGGSVSGGSFLSRSHSDTSLGDGSVMRFLQRQNDCEVGRRERLNMLESELAPTLRPELCERSVRLAEKRQMRLASVAVAGGGSKRGEGTDRDGKQIVRTELEQECTFRPKITEAAAQRDPRSLEDLSTGDQKRREAKLAKVREDLKKKDVSSFAPKVNDFQGVGGRLRILDEPQTLLERITASHKAALLRRERDLRKSQDQELACCTFAPQVKSAPAFVHRMAESHRQARVLKEKENLAEAPRQRPEWH